ncbi:DUF2848 family protein [Streptomyces sp900105755]|uniref:DUF2848 family protein n=1 Tax=Streptomyces sp. 900105755 TaxID=3154389 RepID=UPI0033191F65
MTSPSGRGRRRRRGDPCRRSCHPAQTAIRSVQLGTPPTTVPYWIDVLRSRGALDLGTVLISGTIPLASGVDRFADGWSVELADPATGDTIRLHYDVQPMPAPIG